MLHFYNYLHGLFAVLYNPIHASEFKQEYNSDLRLYFRQARNFDLSEQGFFLFTPFLMIYVALVTAYYPLFEALETYGWLFFFFTYMLQGLFVPVLVLAFINRRFFVVTYLVALALFIYGAFLNLYPEADPINALVVSPAVTIFLMYAFKYLADPQEMTATYKDTQLYLKNLLINFMLYYGGLFYIFVADNFNLRIKFFNVVTSGATLFEHFNSYNFRTQYVLREFTYFDPLFGVNNPFHVTFGFDAMSILFWGLSMILVFLCLIFLWPTIENDNNIVLYLSQLLILLMQLQVTFTTLDILTFFIAFESLLIPMIILIAVWGSKNNRQANNYLIFYTMVSAIPMLLAILLIQYYFGTTNLLILQQLVSAYHPACTFVVESVIWLSFFFAFAVKTPMVPFHIWLPKTHVDAPTVGSVILAGVLLKVGLIGMIRFIWPLFPEVTHFFAPYVSAVATVGVIYSSLITLRQIDMKRIIAYSSVAHMNMAMVSLCSLNVIGLYSTIYLMISHGLIASGLFFLVGFLYNRFHVRSIYYYSGLAMCMPVLAVFFFFFTLANMAFPLTSGFIGEFLLLLGISFNNFYLGFLNALSLLLTTVYSVLLFGRVFLGELKPWLEKIVLNYIWEAHLNRSQGRHLDLYFYEILIASVLWVGIIYLGVYPQAIFDFLNQYYTYDFGVLAQSKELVLSVH